MRDTTLEGRVARGRSRTHKEQKAGWASRRGVLPAVIIVIAAAGIADTAGAETFSEALNREARRLCGDGALPFPTPCGPFTDDRFGVPSGIGGFTTPPAALAIEERLRAARQAEGGWSQFRRSD